MGSITELQTMPLKFRVWDREGKKFCIPSRNSDGYELIYVNDGDYGYSIDLAGGMVAKLGDNAVVSQDTGLKDKNGKSVFLGDIVKTYFVPEHPNTWLVRWKQEECCYELHYLSGPLYGDSLLSDDVEYEVIGNIWEDNSEQD